MPMTMELKGAQELKASLDALPEKVSRKGMTEALAAGGEVVLAAAKDKAPVGKTHALRDGLHMNIVRKKSGPVVVISTGTGSADIQKALHATWKKVYYGGAGISSKFHRRLYAKMARQAATKSLAEHGIKKHQWQGQYYGSMLEFGTKKMAPRPFLSSAVESVQEKAVETIAENLKTFVETKAIHKE